MIVQCPRCSTRWRVGDAAESDNPAFKCGRCHNIFRKFPGAPVGDAGGATAHSRTASAPDNLEFIFPTREAAADERPAATPTPVDTSPPADVRTPPGNDVAAAHAPEVEGASQDDADTVDGDALLAELDAAIEPSDEADADTAENLDSDTLSALDDAAERWHRLDDDPPPPPAPSTPTASADAWMHAIRETRVLHVEDTMGVVTSSGVRAWTRMIVALVALYALLAIAIRVNPDGAAEWLRPIPVLGSLARSDSLLRQIELRNVQGRFQRMRNARRVFVLSGEVVNNSRYSLGGIVVEGTLFATTGEVDRRIVNTGNRTTIKFSELSEREVALLQRFDPRLTIEPGDSVEFSIVFTEPPRDLREVSSRVLSARPTDRAAGPPPFDRARRPASVG